MKLTLRIGCGLLLVFASVAAIAQNTPNAALTQAVTGCLQKGMENSGFFIVANTGEHWELYPGKNISFTEHVGQKVTVVGTVTQRSAEQEKQSQPYEKKEITGAKHADLEVMNLKVVSQTCK